MSEHYPRIRYQGDNGTLLMREGLSFSFYMRCSHQQIAPLVMRTLETYLRAVGPKSLGWYADEEGDLQPLDERAWELARDKLRQGRVPVIELTDASNSEDRYRFEYWGKDLNSPFGPDKTHALCAVTFWLPTEYLEAHGPGRVRELAMELASPLPLCSGHGGLSFNGAYDVPGAGRVLSRYWLRYPGIDFYSSPCHYSWEVGTRVRGPSWLTFLGQPALGELGGAEALRAQLRSPGTTVQELEGGKVLITLGTWPEAGDTEKGELLPAYRELARVLEPCLFHEPGGRMLGRSEEETRRWERRFLD